MSLCRGRAGGGRSLGPVGPHAGLHQKTLRTISHLPHDVSEGDVSARAKEDKCDKFRTSEKKGEETREWRKHLVA